MELGTRLGDGCVQCRYVELGTRLGDGCVQCRYVELGTRFGDGCVQCRYVELGTRLGDGCVQCRYVESRIVSMFLPQYVDFCQPPAQACVYAYDIRISDIGSRLWKQVLTFQSSAVSMRPVTYTAW